MVVLQEQLCIDKNDPRNIILLHHTIEEAMATFRLMLWVEGEPNDDDTVSTEFKVRHETMTH
jgi:hypothetical protein